jgi:O-acetyl-ADP-ribose deacetylase (regulator of RNase III)
VRWTIKAADALSEPGDVLICPANVFLNLSGGVGGEILLRHGDAMQTELHAWLAASGRRHVDRGDVVLSSGAGTRFRAVLHAVAVDGLYQTSAAVIEAVVKQSLTRAAELSARTVILTALGTGFGRLSMTEFGRGLSRLRNDHLPPIDHVVVCVRRPHEADQIRLASSSHSKQG